MEYIEPEIKPVDSKKKTRKIILTSVISAAAVVGIALTYYFTISNIFLDYDNIGLFTYSFKYDDENSGVRIDSIKDSETLPSNFRIPNKLNGRPVVEIAAEVFKDRTELETVQFPETLTTIGDEAFYGCSNLKSFNVPSKIKEVGTSAFDETLWLEEQEDGEVAIGDMLYTYKGEMDYPAAVVSDENTSSSYATVVDLSKYVNMSSGVFKGQSNLVFVEIPESFEEIYSSTFQDCELLEEVKLHEGISVIGNNAFSGCSSLKSIDIPSSVTSIGDYAFSYTALEGEIELTSNIDYVGVGVFEYCKNISKVNISQGFKYISDNLFNGCESLSEVNYAPTEYSKDSYIDYIGANAFKATAITEMNIPFNVTSIKQSAFADCKNLERIYVYNNITGTLKNTYVNASESDDGEIIEAGWKTVDGLYQGLVNFEVSVFNNSPKFKGIVLIDLDTFVTSPLDEVSIPVTLQNLGSSNSESNFFTNTAIETINLYKDTSSISEGEFKDYILNNSVLKILPPSLCSGASSLKNVNFGSDDTSTIQTLGRSIFKDCTSLEKISLPSSITSVGTNAFENCSLLKDVNFSSNSKIATIPDYTFANCTSLADVTLPSTLKTIGRYTFNNCENLINIDLGSNITDIGISAFANCKKLQSISIPDSCKSIANSIFNGCESLSKVKLSSHSNINAISESMFEGTLALKNIVLSENYTKINNRAFANSSLVSITLNSRKVVTLGSDVFNGTSLTDIFVPSDLVDEYKNNSSWSIYKDIIKAL